MASRQIRQSSTTERGKMTELDLVRFVLFSEADYQAYAEALESLA